VPPLPIEARLDAPPPALVELRSEVDAALGPVLDRLLTRVGSHHPSLAPVTDAVRGFVDGGKRIRPALLMLGFEAAGGEDRTTVHGPALALELVHTCALVHDDVIDRAARRRGRPTVHRRFAELHSTSSWHGDPDAYGEAVAILVGDLALVQADELFMSAGVRPDRLLAAFGRYTTLREEVMVGQYLDLHAATTRATDRELALKVASLKSGRYSVTRPLEIGALLAGGRRELLTGLARVGEPLGRAFQLRDDLLGVFGQEAETGKSASSDLVEGKRTLLVAEAAERLDDRGRRLLEEGLAEPNPAAEQLCELRGLLESSGAREAVEDLVATSVGEARQVIEELDLPAGPDTALAQLTDYLEARTA